MNIYMGLEKDGRKRMGEKWRKREREREREKKNNTLVYS
jgi:hypothetical protein